MRSARGFAAPLLATVFLAANAAGQTPSPTGNVYGTALDADGNLVNGVTVTLTGPGAVQTATTDRRGDFHFLNLSPGSYSVEIRQTGFEPVRRDVTVALGNVVLTVTLPVAGVAAEITVVGGAPGMDGLQVVTGATYGAKELESIPTSRDIWAVLQQVPGVLLAGVNVGGVTPGIPAFVGKGSPPGQNTYNLDGVAVSVGGISPFLFDFDSLSNIEVTTGGSDLSLATPGVRVNLVTKRGTNDLQGSARGLYAGGSGWDYGVEVGGPLWRDHVWLWGAFAHNDFLGNELFNALGEPIPSQQTLEHWNAKLNAQLVPANTLTLGYTNFKRTILGFLFTPDRSEESNWNNVRPGLAYKIEDSQVFSPKLFASFYLSYVKTRSTSTPIGGVDEQAYQDVDFIWRRSYTIRRILDDKHQAGLNSSSFFDTGDLAHEVKFGFGYRHLRVDTGLSWPGDQLVGYGIPQYFPDGTQYFEADITRIQNARAEANAYDAFVGDTIRAGNWTFNFGIRYDYQQGKNLPSDVPANPVFPEVLPAVQYGGDSGYPITWRLFQPRVGATYALGGNRTLLRGSYARFTDELDHATILSVNAFPDVAELGYVWNDLNQNHRVEQNEVDLSTLVFYLGVDPDNPGSPTQINQISKSLKPATTDEFIVSLERQFSPGFSGSLAYTYRTIHNLEFSPLIGTTRASYQYLGNASGRIVGDDGFTLGFSEPYYGLTNCPEPCVGTLLQNRPDATETYSGVELQLIKAYAHGWMARVSFAYNDWEQQIGPGAIVDPNNEPPGTNASGPAGLINATWQFNVSGMIELPLGISAGVNLFGRQGFPIPYYVIARTTDVRNSAPAIQIGPAARYRLPDVYQLDLQLARAFRIGSEIVVIPQFACFNVINSRTVLGRDGQVGVYDTLAEPVFDRNEGFDSVLETVHGRVFRGGLRITF